MKSSEDGGFFDDPYVPSGDPGIEAISIEVEGELDEAMLRGWLENLTGARSADIYRMKGILAVAGHPRQTILQGVHRLFEIYPGGRWSGSRGSRLVFIGRDLDHRMLRSGLEGCRA